MPSGGCPSVPSPGSSLLLVVDTHMLENPSFAIGPYIIYELQIDML